MCFCPLYSPTAPSPPTGSRQTSSSLTAAPCRTRWPKRGASRSRSRWDWRRSPHFRVKTDQAHTTRCQVNINKSLYLHWKGASLAVCSAPGQYSCVSLGWVRRDKCRWYRNSFISWQPVWATEGGFLLVLSVTLLSLFSLTPHNWNQIKIW